MTDLLDEAIEVNTRLLAACRAERRRVREAFGLPEEGEVEPPVPAPTIWERAKLRAQQVAGQPPVSSLCTR